MSVPHTGRLTATIDDMRCTFDGDAWQTPVPALTAELNLVTDRAIKHHYDIHGVALQVFADLQLGARARVLEWEGDGWDEELPPGAED